MAADLADQLKGLKSRIDDYFSKKVVEGAELALSQIENPLRLNFFSTAMRILFEHLMDTFSPPEEVKKASWFKPERQEGSPTRWQRIVFAIQGGLSDDFVQTTLNVDVASLRTRLLKAVDELSKHVHGRENTLVLDRSEQDSVVAAAVASMTSFLNALWDCRSAVLEPITEALDDLAVDALLSETIDSVDELASHYMVDGIDVGDITVSSLGSASIIYTVTGTISVTLQYGSNSDIRRDEGALIEESFPFHCDIEVPIDDLWNLGLAESTFGVDTSAWHDAMSPDEE